VKSLGTTFKHFEQYLDSRLLGSSMDPDTALIIGYQAIVAAVACQLMVLYSHQFHKFWWGKWGFNPSKHEFGTYEFSLWWSTCDMWDCLKVGCTNIYGNFTHIEDGILRHPIFTPKNRFRLVVTYIKYPLISSYIFPYIITYPLISSYIKYPLISSYK